MITRLRPTFTFDQERIDALRAIAPEAFADGRINWEVLHDALGDHLEDEGRDAEHFGLFWPGKREARRVAALPSTGTLRPVSGEGVNENSTRNIFIEGDNLEALKLLQKSYAGRVRMIYIDPPYNTGSDFIYSDSFTQPLEEYLRATGQADEIGRVLVTNTQADGRYHSNWLNMMYPRLRLARHLLRSDGVIFVSIDDNEVHNLRGLMNEVFGEENFVAQIVLKNKAGAGAKPRGFIPVHEFVLCYARSRESIDGISLPMTEEQTKLYNKRDEHFALRGPYGTWALATTSMGDRPNLRFPILHDGEEIWPEKQWLWSRERVEEAQQKNELVFNRKSDGLWSVRFKRYLKDETGEENPSTPTTFWDGPYTHEGTRDMDALFTERIFTFPKPIALLRKMLSLRFLPSSAVADDIVLDFFAGSCTTAHAVVNLNHEDGGNRRFIMVQFPEPTPSDSLARRGGFDTIAEIGKERIRRVIQRIRDEDAGKLTTGRDAPEDLGFRVFKLDRSNYRAWHDFDGSDVAELQTLFDRFESPLVEGWEIENVLTEVMLMEGFPLDSMTEIVPNLIWWHIGC